jgi:hypothetical protein
MTQLGRRWWGGLQHPLRGHHTHTPCVLKDLFDNMRLQRPARLLCGSPVGCAAGGMLCANIHWGQCSSLGGGCGLQHRLHCHHTHTHEPFRTVWHRAPPSETRVTAIGGACGSVRSSRHAHYHLQAALGRVLTWCQWRERLAATFLCAAVKIRPVGAWQLLHVNPFLCALFD